MNEETNNEEPKIHGYLLADSTLALLGHGDLEGMIAKGFGERLSELRAKRYKRAFDRFVRFGEGGLDSEDRAALRLGLGQ